MMRYTNHKEQWGPQERLQDQEFNRVDAQVEFVQPVHAESVEHTPVLVCSGVASLVNFLACNF